MFSELRGAPFFVPSDAALWTESWAPELVVETDTWLFRADGGVTNRANSACARGSAASRSLPAAILELESFYRARRLPPVVQIGTGPGSAEVDNALEARGYALHTPSLVQTRLLNDTQPAARGASEGRGHSALVSDAPPSAWFTGYLATNGRSGRQRSEQIQRALLTRGPARYLMKAARGPEARSGPDTVSGTDAAAPGPAVAVARLSVHGDIAVLSCMGVASAERGRGHAASLLDAVLAEASAWGCTAVALQVTADNVAARRLYTRAGFQTVDRYHYRVGMPAGR